MVSPSNSLGTTKLHDMFALDFVTKETQDNFVHCVKKNMERIYKEKIKTIQITDIEFESPIIKNGEYIGSMDVLMRLKVNEQSINVIIDFKPEMWFTDALRQLLSYKALLESKEKTLVCIAVPWVCNCPHIRYDDVMKPPKALHGHYEEFEKIGNKQHCFIFECDGYNLCEAMGTGMKRTFSFI